MVALTTALATSQISDCQLRARVPTPPVDALVDSLAEVTRDDQGAIVEVVFHQHSKLTSKSLDQLQNLGHLKRLSLGSRQLTNEHLVHVAGLVSLESLGLSQANITDDGVAHLSKLVKLQSLQLDGCRKLTDGCLLHLKTLPALRELHLGETRITVAGVRTLSGRQFTDLKLPTELYVDKCLGPYLEAIEPATELDLSGWTLSDEGMPELARQPQLKSLVLPGGWRREKLITDAGLVHLRRLSKLESLSLAETNINGAGLRHLSALQHLKSLDLAGTKVLDEHMTHLEQLTTLESLRLAFCQEITDAGLTPLSRMSRLRHLNLGVYPGNSKLTDKGLLHLAGMTQLRELYLTDMPVTDVGLGHLETIPGLELLWLGGCMKITDRGLASVATINSLKWINLNDCSAVSGAGVLLVQQKLPDCEVSHNTTITWMHHNAWWVKPTGYGIPFVLALLVVPLVRKRQASKKSPESIKHREADTP